MGEDLYKLWCFKMGVLKMLNFRHSVRDRVESRARFRVTFSFIFNHTRKVHF